LLATIQWCLFKVSKPAFHSDLLIVVGTVGSAFNRIAEHHLQTSNRNDWDSAENYLVKKLTVEIKTN